MKHLLGYGWRGVVTYDDERGRVTKKARHAAVRGAIHKESILLRHLNSYGYTFVPQVIDSDIDRFSYTYIPGQPLQTIRPTLSAQQRYDVINRLVTYARYLDMAGVCHGELAHPTKNILWDPHRLTIIDFERGTFVDPSKQKNNHHLRQRLWSILPDDQRSYDQTISTNKLLLLLIPILTNRSYI